MPGWLFPAAMAFVCWGIWAFLPKLTTAHIDARSAVVYEAVGGILVAVAVLALMGFKPAGDSRGIALATITGSLGVGGALAYLYAMQKGPVILISAMTALYPVIAIFLAVVALHEPISLRQGMGIVLALIAMLLIAG